MARSRRRPTRRSARIGAILVASVVAFLYYRPLSSYLETRGALAQRSAAVAELRAERADLQSRLQRASTTVSLSRQARRIGLVRPGEELFIVKGIRVWRMAQRTGDP
jgi:hypothetical protein